MDPPGQRSTHELRSHGQAHSRAQTAARQGKPGDQAASGGPHIWVKQGETQPAHTQGTHSRRTQDTTGMQ
jgi:hypothetical protein